MATKAERTQTIAALEKAFSGACGIYFTDFSRITVEKMTKLRAEFRKQGATYLVIKNSLGRKALERCDGAKKDLALHLAGHIGAALVDSEATIPAKIIKEFQKENQDLLPVKVAYVNGVLYQADDVKKLADLPSREALLSMLLSCLKAPLGNLAGSLNAVMTKFVGVLEAVKQKKEAPAAG